MKRLGLFSILILTFFSFVDEAIGCELFLSSNTKANGSKSLNLLSQIQKAPMTEKTRNIKIDFGCFSKGTLQLELFNGKKVEIDLIGRQVRKNGFTWVGSAKGKPKSRVLFTIIKGRVSGTIQIGYTRHTVTFLNGDTHLLTKVNPLKYPFLIFNI